MVALECITPSKAIFIIILLCGGDKSNQDADIIKACELAKIYKGYDFENQAD